MAKPCTGAEDGSGPVLVLMQADEDSREMYAEYFTHLGWCPIAVTSAREVLAFAPYAAAIVTDIPADTHIDVDTFMMTLKESPDTRDIPVVVVTAWPLRAHRELAERAGCDAFLLKPCLPDDLLETVTRLIAIRFRSARGMPC